MYRGSAKLVDRAPSFAAITFVAFCVIDAFWRQLEAAEQSWLLYVFFAVSFIAYAGAYYFLHHVLLQRIGLRTNSHGLLDFIGLSLFVGSGVAIATLLLIIPGIVLLCGWFVALPYLLSHDESVLDAPARSWDMTSGYKVEIFLASLLSTFPTVVLSLLEFLLGFYSEFLSVVASAVVTMLNVLLTIAALAILLESAKGRQPMVD